MLTCGTNTATTVIELCLCFMEAANFLCVEHFMNIVILYHVIMDLISHKKCFPCCWNQSKNEDISRTFKFQYPKCIGSSGYLKNTYKVLINIAIIWIRNFLPAQTNHASSNASPITRSDLLVICFFFSFVSP